MDEYRRVKDSINIRGYKPIEGICTENMFITELKDNLDRLDPDEDPENEIVKAKLMSPYVDHQPLTNTQKWNNLEDVIKVACSEGYYNYDEAKWGVANGLLTAESMIKGTDPILIHRPKRFIIDKYRKLNRILNITAASVMTLASISFILTILSMFGIILK